MAISPNNGLAKELVHDISVNLKRMYSQFY